MAVDRQFVPLEMTRVCVLEGRGLHKFYRNGHEEVVALKDVTLSVNSGEIVALVGASGSGKSTLLGCLSGLIEPDGGFAAVLNQRMSHRPEAEKASLRARYMGLLPQVPALIGHLTVRENARLQQLLAGRRDLESVDRVLERVGLRRQADHLPRTLSGGEAARAGLVVAIAANAPVLMCDEPTAEVDAPTEAAIIEVLRQLSQEGVGILVATHSHGVANTARRIVEIRSGSIRHDQ